MRWQEWKWRRKGGTHRESLRPSWLQRSQTHSFVAQVDNARRKHPTVAAALGCGALTAAALYCLYWVVAVALFLHEGLDLPSQ